MRKKMKTEIRSRKLKTKGREELGRENREIRCKS